MHLTNDRASAHLISPNRPLPSAWAAVAIIGALLLILVLDSVTGAAPVQHLYYLPIVFAGVRFGRGGGLSAAVAAIVFYHLSPARALTFRYEESDILQMAVFVAAGLISARLADDAQALRQLALTDDLTGLHNLRSFEEELRLIVRAGREARTPISLLVLDLDRLKSVNDGHGHLAGAEAVRMLGRMMAARLPAHATACRYGGDEFVVALAQTDERAAVDIAEGLRRDLNAAAPSLAGIPFQPGALSISIGVACRTFAHTASGDAAGNAAAGEELFRAADAALYVAKSTGRNRVSVGSTS